MKKAYVKPTMENESFVPNQFVAACENPSSYVGYCDISGEVWKDTNLDKKITKKAWGGDTYIYTNTACGELYESNEEPKFNAYVVNDWKVTKYIYILGSKVPTEWEAVNPIPVYNYKNDHVTQNIDPVKHYNVSI